MACGEAECAPGENCVGEACSCIQAIHGDTILRTDGTVVDLTGVGTTIEEDDTGLPLTGVTEIFEGMWHGCALRDHGTVWCWSSASNGNLVGQLGNGSLGGTPPQFQATPVTLEGGATLTGVEHLNSGSSRSYLAALTCAILDDSSLWCWGDRGEEGSSSGQGFFNDGLTGHRPFATPILAAPGTPLTGVDQVSIGGRHVCTVRGDDVWCWGTNVGGPLGQGDEMPRQYPVQVTLPATASRVSAGFDTTCAHVDDTVYCWGTNNSGQIGVGVPADNTNGCINFCVTSPEAVVDEFDVPLAGVEDLNAVYLGNCARRDDDTLWCWGSGVANVAAPLSVAGSPVTDVAMHTSAGSSNVPNTIRYLTRQDVYQRASQTIAIDCG